MPGPTVAAVGERGVLARVVARLAPADRVLVGPGDDCAVLAAPDGRTVLTTDMMVHGPDFRFAWSSPEDLGWKAAATNLSDVAAMGARPTALLVALAVPSHTPVTTLERFADGLRDGCAALAPGCGVVGGDLSTSPTFTVTITAVGDLEGRAPVLRSGARPGNALAVAGDLGTAALGLALLFRHGVNTAGEPDASAVAAWLRRADGHDREAVARQRRPVPPIAAGVAAAAAGATAMLDLSDGLAIDAGRLADASGVTVDLDADAVPTGAALHGGEDHSLLAAFPEGTVLPPPFRRIGRIVARGPEPLLRHGVPVDATGWDPYADWDGGIG